MDKTKDVENAKTIAGPRTLFSGSFILEFLEPPPSLDATVLMRSTYTGPMQKLAKLHPQSPPLHLHFDQAESFWVAKGTVGTTEGWEAKDRVSTPNDAPCVLDPWVPHSFWPDPDSKEDSVVYVWAHPTAVPEPMDKAFFENLLIYLSDISEKKANLSLLQIMTMQHASATAIVMLPTAWWLGPLRWWVPWAFQVLCAKLGGLFGYKALMEKYTSKEDWENFLKTKKA